MFFYFRVNCLFLVFDLLHRRAMNLPLHVLQRFQDIEENHILHMKTIIQSYSQSVDETHVQIGEVSVYTQTHTCAHTYSQAFLWVELVSC